MHQHSSVNATSGANGEVAATTLRTAPAEPPPQRVKPAEESGSPAVLARGGGWLCQLRPQRASPQLLAPLLILSVRALCWYALDSQVP